MSGESGPEDNSLGCANGGNKWLKCYRDIK